MRPGEKLYEELLIGEDVIGTDHPKIMRAEEERLSYSELQALLESITDAIEDEDSQLARSLLERAVAGFKPSSPVVDWLLKPECENPSLH